MQTKGFQHSVIYKLTSSNTPTVFIGYSTNFSKEFMKLKHHYKSLDDKTLHYSSHELLKYTDTIIQKIEDFPCSSLEELQKRHREILKEHKDKNVSLSNDLENDLEFSKKNKINRFNNNEKVQYNTKEETTNEPRIETKV